MAITPTYPGVYIEELPSTTHTVTPAPTSVTVFVGYSHPFKTKSAFGTAQHIFNFTDYQGYFGGYFDLGEWLPDYLGNAVFQFFQNGGTEAWVVGLQTHAFVDANGNPVTDAQGQEVELAPPTLMIDMSAAGAAADSVTVTLTAQEPGGTDPANNNAAVGTVTQVQFQSRRQSDPATQNYDIADIIITHGPTIQETYKGVKAADIVTALAPSSLVSAVINQAGATPAQFPDPLTNNGDLAYTEAPPANSTLFNPADYGPVFATGASLDVDVPIFNIMALPGVSPVSEAQNAVLSQALVVCEEKRAFFIMDAPPNATTSGLSPPPTGTPLGTPAPVTMDAFWRGPTPPPVSTNGAIYFPYLQTVNPLTLQPMNSPPSGFVAGIYAREDAGYSVGKAPAGLETTIQGSGGVVPWGRMTDQQQGPLNNDGVNCLREFPGLGPPVVFGARTLVYTNQAFQEWKYVPVRRTALFLEQSLYMSLGWAVFQPNDTPLWNAMTLEVEAFMLTLFRAGSYFQGSTPSEAFLVQCDSTTTTPTDQQNGRVNILVGFAPLKPAEFVVIQISQLAGQTQT